MKPSDFSSPNDSGDVGGDGSAVYPMYFGLSCAAFAALDHGGGGDVGELLLRGSSFLLGLLVERARRKREMTEEKLAAAEMELREMKLRRSEDARANEKVVAIFASHEQGWIAERKRLRGQVSVLAAALREDRARKEEEMAALARRAEEAEREARGKEELLEQERKRKEELEEGAAASAAEAASEIRRHKTALMELVSDQRRLEAALSRAIRQAEAATERMEAAVSEAEKVSGEVVELRKDTEQKEKVLSAMLRKSKLDSAEKKLLSTKETKMSNAKKKKKPPPAMEIEKWRRSFCDKSKRTKTCILLDYFTAGDGGALHHHHHRHEDESFDRNGIEGGGIEGVGDFEQLRSWVRLETERYAAILEQRHYEETEAFVEQLQSKDEELEALKWQTRQLRSRAEELDGTISQFRDDNVRLESMLSEKERELKQLKDQFGSWRSQKVDDSSTTVSAMAADLQALWSEVKITTPKGGPREEEEQELKPVDDPEGTPTNRAIVSVRQMCSEEAEGTDFFPVDQEEKSIVLISTASMEDGEGGGKALALDPRNRKKSSISSLLLSSSWKMDIHALGISYKIKRLKQQLLVLEKLAGETPPGGRDEPPTTTWRSKIDENSPRQIKGLLPVISLLNKQVKRYQSLEEKTDELCRKMHENYRSGGGGRRTGRTREQAESLARFLEETFELQRFMVATGQKLMDIEAKITCSFVVTGADERVDESRGFNMTQFAGLVGNLFRDIQRGLEVRIARIIGDIEGTLASDGILRR